jgi:uncharacterized ion transporter superfamily protein YfcC
MEVTNMLLLLLTMIVWVAAVSWNVPSKRFENASMHNTNHWRFYADETPIV